ncbi:hypothetical protein SCHPADRAFT_898745 [Schizopora paradoxa]|uniref:Uncharacterized protein n=1 Tax=Schizopora paradoxa TaxID=27342 RepID=A0A0H2SQX6_9AGAM|nr:hypothetical protein SCHPADRAFT_898745 [Schizopora paradoxa]
MARRARRMDGRDAHIRERTQDVWFAQVGAFCLLFARAAFPFFPPEISPANSLARN